MTFFLNSTSNLSSNGWKLPAEGVNESCMREHEEGGGGWQTWRSGRRREGEGGLCLLAAVSRECGEPRKAPRLLLEGSGCRVPRSPLSEHISACKIRVKGSLRSPLLIAK